MERSAYLTGGRRKVFDVSEVVGFAQVFDVPVVWFFLPPELDTTVQVVGPSRSDLVIVYKGVERESYSCAPDCEKRLTLGDSSNYFSGILTQSGSRIGGAGGGAPGPR